MAFGATNKPGTCLWCGEKLRQKYHTKWKSTDKKPSACRAFINDGTYEAKRCGTKHFRRNAAGNWQCLECHVENNSRKEVESRTPAYNKLGNYGDGFFCNKTHARHFAIATATNGYRLPARLQSVNMSDKKAKSA